MKHPKVFADFNNSDSQGRIRLNTNGTLEDIKRLQIKLHHNLIIKLSDNEGLETTGNVEYSESESMWVAKIDWSVF